MPHLIPNLFEKAYTPYTAKLAPKNLWSRPQLGKSTTQDSLCARRFVHLSVLTSLT